MWPKITGQKDQPRTKEIEFLLPSFGLFCPFHITHLMRCLQWHCVLEIHWWIQWIPSQQASCVEGVSIIRRHPLALASLWFKSVQNDKIIQWISISKWYFPISVCIYIYMHAHTHTPLQLCYKRVMTFQITNDSSICSTRFCGVNIKKNIKARIDDPL